MNVLRSSALTAVLVLAASRAPAQAGARLVGLTPAAPRVPAESARVLRTARSAQAEFERVRYGHLPWKYDDGARSGACDERIGRYCIWFDDSDADWTPPPEHPDVVRARAALLAALDQAAAAAPGDAWIAGQRVRYLVEAGRTADASRAARECRAERWWCLALDGYALHFARDYRGAESAFAAALGAMPADLRHEWDDLSPTVASGDARAIRRMDPPQRATAVRRLWWLADPFWMEPGNDRLTEHYARLVADRFQDRAKNTEHTFWADDLREILLRWGQPAGWERVRPRVMQGLDEGMTTHYAASFEFIPTLEMVRAPLAIRAEDWKTDEKSAHSLYSPPAVRRFGRLPHQVAVFRRGDSADVVAAFAMQPDSLPPAPRLDAGVVLMRDAGAEPVLRRSTVEGTRGVLRITAAPEETVLSLEAREPVSRRAARARFGVDLRRPLARGIAISDVLLLDRADARPQSLDEAAPLARGSTEFRAGERLALYWEVYRPQAGGDSVSFSLALARRPAGARHVAEALGLTRAAVRMRWTEEAPAGAVLPRSIAIALPRAAPGEYVLEVAVRTRAGAEASTVREITVVR